MVKSKARKTRHPILRELEKLSLASIRTFASYPAFFTASISVLGEVPDGTKICALSVAKLTVALAPGTLFRDLSIVPTQDEQVIPEMDRSICSRFGTF